MRTLSLSLKTVLFILIDLLGINLLFRFLHRGKIKVLLFHSVEHESPVPHIAVDPGDFRRQLAHLKRSFGLPSLERDGSWKGLSACKVNVFLTFDDGFLDNVAAISEVRSQGISCALFVLGGAVETGEPPQYLKVSQLSEGDRLKLQTVTGKDVRALADLGVVIGSHGMDHRNHVLLSPDESVKDAFEAQEKIERAAGVRPLAFAFPWGAHRKEQLDPLLQHYVKIFTVEHGFNAPGDRVIKRNEVTGYWHMKCAASGALDFFRRLVGQGGG